MEEEIESLKNKLLKNDEEIESLKNKQLKKDEEIEILKNKLLKKDEEIESLKKEEIENLKNKQLKKDEEIESVKNKLLKKDEEIESLKNKLLKKDEEVESLKNKLLKKDEEVESLKNKQLKKDEEIESLKNKLLKKEEEIKIMKNTSEEKHKVISKLISSAKESYIYSDIHEQSTFSVLSSKEISRYSRQLLLPEIGIQGQTALKQKSVLIVGAGGLGCPAGILLAAAGIGKIGIVDYDVVEISNLHRQICHTVDSIGIEKSKSLETAIKRNNPHVTCVPHTMILNASNIAKIIESYDYILDASDNVPTRYLLNDAAVLFKKPLISGSALRFEGQLTIYNYLEGPCYRCLFPKPPPFGTVTNCSEGGVLGAVTGVIGCLQALEVIKMAIGVQTLYCKRMLVFDGLAGVFRDIKLRNKKTDCRICGDNPSIRSLIDYEAFCGTTACDKVPSVTLLKKSDRISCSQYRDISDNGSNHCLIDVRPSNEFNICCLPNAVNIPFETLTQPNSLEIINNCMQGTGCDHVYIVCRRGNDSQKAVIELRKHFPVYVFRDIVGGLQAWQNEIDLTFPMY